MADCDSRDYDPFTELDGCSDANIFCLDDVYDHELLAPDAVEISTYYESKSVSVKSTPESKSVPKVKTVPEIKSALGAKTESEAKSEAKSAPEVKPGDEESKDGYIPDEEMPGVGGTRIIYNGDDDIIPGIATQYDDVRGAMVREDIVRENDDGMIPYLSKRLNSGLSVWFMPTAIEDSNEYKYGVSAYVLKMYGVLFDGSKTEVTITGIHPFFDIEPRKQDEAKLHKGALGSARVDDVKATRSGVETLLQEVELTSRDYKIEVVEADPLEYKTEKMKWLRVTTPTLWQRKKALNAVRNAGYNTASDDRSCYYRKAAREHLLSLSGWSILENYTYAEREGKTLSEENNFGYTRRRSPLAQHHISVDVAHIKAVVNQMGTKEERDAASKKLQTIPQMMRDRTLVATWDIETRSTRGTGDVPDASFDEDRTFAICLTAHWKDSMEPLREYELVDVAANSTSGRVTIVCGNQRNLLKAFVLIYRALAPDVFFGFNDSCYDWPFIIEKLRKEGLLIWAWNKMSASPDTKLTEENVLSWKVRRDQKIKISPEETFFSTYMTLPGCVPIDIRACYKKIFPKGETPARGSLKFYLGLVKLPGKADMPYKRMDRYYDAACAIEESVRDLEKTGEVDEKLRADIAASAENMRAVLHYCRTDALRCQQLQVRRNVINDYREVASLSYVSLADCHYYAGGMKVCNLLGAYSWQRGSLSTMQSRERTETGKYPGAHVFDPEKGLTPNPIRMGVVDRLAAEVQRRAAMPAAPAVAPAEPAIPTPAPAEPAVPTKSPAPMPPSEEISEDDQLRRLTHEELWKKIKQALKNLAGDRPVTGLDFSSLYPSLIMTYNLSPEKLIYCQELAESLIKQGVPLYKIEFQFNGRTVRAWSIPHENRQADIGLFPTVLIDLFNRRAEVKKVMGKHGAVKEFIEGIQGAAQKNHSTPYKELLGQLAAAKEEVTRCDAALAPGAPPPRISPGATLGEELAELKRLRGNALEQIQVASDILDRLQRRQKSSRELADEAEAEIKETYENACFNYSCANSKQNAYKVYMNSFYGESGNSISPFFRLPLAGGVTEAGRRNIQMVADFVRSRGYRIKYGDTDSLYLIPPNGCFEDCDMDYLTGKINREQWWEAMVRITMRSLNQIRDEVNAFLKADNGSSYLKMAYEEVLYPVDFTGKKKYFGIPHLNEVNFRPKKLFIRGIDVVKQGQPELARSIGYDIMWASMGLNNARDVRQIVEDVLRHAILERKWEFEDFIKTDAWKPNKNNIPVHKCIARMRVRHHAEMSENGRLVAAGLPPKPILYELPEVGERFSYVLVETGTEFTLRGNKSKPGKGDLMVFATAAKALNMEIDVSYYMISNVVGLCARFINSDPEFLPTTPGLTEKQIDEITQKNAKKSLTGFIKRLKNVDAKMMLRRGHAYRRAYKAAATTAFHELVERLGYAAAEVLHGEWLSYELLNSWCDDEPDEEAAEDVNAPIVDTASKMIDGLWNIAGVFAEHLNSCGSWCDELAAAFGIAPNGFDLAADGSVRQTVNNLRRVLQSHKTNRIDVTHNSLEIALRKQFAQLSPSLADIANRYESDLARLTHENRAREHETNNTIGEYTADVPVVATVAALSHNLYSIIEDDRGPLEETLRLWFKAVGVRVLQHRAEKFHEHAARLWRDITANGRVVMRVAH